MVYLQIDIGKHQEERKELAGIKNERPWNEGRGWKNFCPSTCIKWK
jgi:hypothetical protein